MIKAIVKATLMISMLPLLLHAEYILRNDLLKIEAQQRINEMGEELKAKTGVTAYLVASNEHFKERYNLIEYAKQYEANMSKPYVLFIFAPYASIIEKSDARGRVGIIPSSQNVRALYNYEDVRDAAIDIVAAKDSNTDEDKFNIGILQGYSELADNIAKSKGLKLEKTIPNEMGLMLTILRILVYTGTAVLLWIFALRPLWMRIKNVKQ
jgi:hypothetical protein